MGLDFVSGQYGCLFSICQKYVINSLIHGHFHIGLVIIPRQNKKMTAQRSHSNTVWFNFQTYIIISINLVSQVTLRSSGTDILYGCHLLRCLYNILYFLWLYNAFFIILWNILKIAELDWCQIIILSIYVPSTHA
jgi:hypothetical protein